MGPQRKLAWYVFWLTDATEIPLADKLFAHGKSPTAQRDTAKTSDRSLLKKLSISTSRLFMLRFYVSEDNLLCRRVAAQTGGKFWAAARKIVQKNEEFPDLARINF